MSKSYDALITLRDALAAIPAIRSCAIGLEANITPDSYPLIRIVPSRDQQEPNGWRRLEAIIYYGEPVHEFEAGIEEIYRRHLDMQETIIAAAQGINRGFEHAETWFDEDRLPAYKMLALRFEVRVRLAC